jgi:hypothetical protein
MDERVTKCAKAMADAMRDLLSSANSEVEMFGLFAALQNEIGVVIERAVEEGLNVLETKLRKNDQEGKV